MMLRTVLTALLVGCSSCHPVPAPAPAPVPMADAGPGDACSRACAHLRANGCPDGAPTPGGVSCETVCRHAVAEPAAMMTPTYLACLATLQGCAESECPR